MEIAYYQQLWSDLQLILTNTAFNFVYCVSAAISKISFLKVAPIYLLTGGIVLIPGLNNPLAVVHPALLLFTYLKTCKKLYMSKLLVFLMWISLFLGGWWASQEFNWGGWWNWDLIETPALLVSLMILMGLHRFNRTYITKVSGRFLLMLYLLLLLVNTRFLSSSSVHSFISGSLVFEKYSLLLTYDFVVFILISVNLFNLGNLITLKFLCIYVVIYAIVSIANKLTKIDKYHKIAVILIYQLVVKSSSMAMLEFYKPVKISYDCMSYQNQYISAIGLVESWYKEISLKF